MTPNGTAYPTFGRKGPSPVVNPSGKITGSQFIGGSGGLNGQVITLRIMDPVGPRGAGPGYPNGYMRYSNPLGQAVDPFTGNTVPNSCGHYGID